MAMIIRFAIALVLLMVPAWVAAEPIGPQKKLIIAGASNFARVESFASDVAEMERRVPVDGVAFYPPSIDRDGERIRLGRPFRGDRLRIEDFEPFIADLRAAKPTRYKHNFLYTYLTTGEPEVAVPDWFDAEFDAVIHNWRVIAEFCKRAGLVGVMFDDEVYYGTYLWTYDRLEHASSKSAREYADQAFLRGAQIMRAITEVFPDIHFLSLHGPSQARPPGDPAVKYGLMSAFFDGLLSEAKGNTRIIDGHEVAYGYRYPVTYATARNAMKQEYRRHSRVAAKYDEHFRAAFSFYLGPYGSMQFTEDVSSNYYTPEEFEYALHHALKHSDEYVWLYTRGAYWWKMGTKGGILMPPAYHEALARVRMPHPDPPVLRNLDAHAAPKPGSAKPPRKLGWPVRGQERLVGYDEEETFGDLWDRYQELSELSNRWRFRIDPLKQGAGDWFGPQVDELDWFWITSDLPWDDHGYRLYDGYGWYRQEFRAPMIPEGKRVYLAFGAVAHGAEVYINGELAGQHNMDGWAYTAGKPWQQRFLIDATGRLRTESENTIAVRVVDYGTWGGGIWKPVKLIAEK